MKKNNTDTASTIVEVICPHCGLVSRWDTSHRFVRSAERPLFVESQYLSDILSEEELAKYKEYSAFIYEHHPVQMDVTCPSCREKITHTVVKGWRNIMLYKPRPEYIGEDVQPLWDCSWLLKRTDDYQVRVAPDRLKR